MATKPFISARIPEPLLEQVESYAEARGESKSSIVVEALERYFEPETSDTATKSSLENRISYFERWVFNRISQLEHKIDVLGEQWSLLAKENQKPQEAQLLSPDSGKMPRPRRIMPGPTKDSDDFEFNDVTEA